MTPTQLLVERDRLLEGGRSPEEVERMQRGADPRIEAAILRVAEERCGYCHSDIADSIRECTECAPIKYALAIIRTAPLLPAESGAGVSTPIQAATPVAVELPGEERR